MAIICREHRLLFIMVPGTGCSVVGRALREKLSGSFLPEEPISRDGYRVQRKHNTLPELIEYDLLSKEELEKYCVFASVRNPFDRWVTYYQRYEGEWVDYYEGVVRRRIDGKRENLSDEEVERRFERLEARMNKLRRRQRIIRALGFNAWMMGTFLRWALDGSNGKVGGIARYAFPMLEGVDLAIRQERLNEGLNRILEIAGVDCQIDLPKKNTTSGKKPYAEYYAWPTREFGKLLLGEEMDELEYEFEGPTNDNALVRIGETELSSLKKKRSCVETRIA